MQITMGSSTKFVVLLLLVIGFVESASSHRILGIFPLNAKSHMMMFEQLMKGLARKGHQVDVVSTFPQKTPYPNYTDIEVPSILPKFVNNLSYERVQGIISNNMVNFMATMAGNLVCEKILEHPQIQNIIKNPPQNPPYDLVIAEIFGAHCFMAFGRHLNVPVIGASSSALYPWGNGMIANPENLAFAPNNLLPFTENMSFWDRLYNVLHTTYYKKYFDYYTSPQTDSIKKHFGPNAPGVRESEQSLALILTNSHPALNGIKPSNPALIEVGGLHVQDDGPEIPAADKKWLDESKDGFVYFTFGSMITIESFPHEVLSILYKSLAKLAPTRVLMKIPQPELLPPGLPKNVRTFSWMPQLKVLKHKNIRAFITHGGLMGTQEAITCAVPMIGMPLFADQFLNVDLYVAKKIAIRLDYNDMTEEKLDTALHEILHNPIYRDTIRDVSRRFLDRPFSPLETACYWVEYVIRNGDKALRSPAFDFSWWQVALLDVYVALFLTGVLILILAIALVQFLMNNIFGTSQKRTPRKSDKKRN